MLRGMTGVEVDGVVPLGVVPNGTRRSGWGLRQRPAGLAPLGQVQAWAMPTPGPCWGGKARSSQSWREEAWGVDVATCLPLSRELGPL